MVVTVVMSLRMEAVEVGGGWLSECGGGANGGGVVVVKEKRLYLPGEASGEWSQAGCTLGGSCRVELMSAKQNFSGQGVLWFWSLVSRKR